MRRLSVLVTLFLTALAPVGLIHAQDPAALASHAQTLERRLAHAPSARTRCDLGFTYYRLARLDDAARELDAAIVTLGHPRADADQRLLAQCLYSRGRVALDQHDLQTARSSFERSRRLHATDAAGAAAEALAHRALSDLGPEERAVAAECDPTFDDDYTIAIMDQLTTPSGTRWSIVECGGYDDGEIDVVACDGTHCTLVELDTDAYFNGGGGHDVTAMVLHGGPTPIVEIRIHGEAGDRPDCCSARIPTIDEDELALCQMTSDGAACWATSIANRIDTPRFVLNATVDDTGVTLHLRSGRWTSEPYEPPPPLDRHLTLAELLAPPTQ